MHVIELGPVCNNACVFCARSDGRGACGWAPKDELQARVDQRAAVGVRLCLVGGEPTLHPSLLQLAQSAAERGATVAVQTNGRRLAYLAYARELARCGVTQLDVSLHGTSASMHDYHTGVFGSFTQTVTGIEQACRVGMRVGMTFVATRSNYRHLAQMVRLGHVLGAEVLRVRRVELAGRAKSRAASLLVPEQLLAPYFKQAEMLGAELGLPVVRGVVPTPLVEYLGANDESKARVGASSPGAMVETMASTRARPALGELRKAEIRTGEDLRELFPGLLRPEQGR